MLSAYVFQDQCSRVEVDRIAEQAGGAALADQVESYPARLGPGLELQLAAV